jgi:hypothetical protein
MYRSLTPDTDEAVLSTAAMRKLDSPKPRFLNFLKRFFEAVRPVVREKEPEYSSRRELFSFKICDDAFPTWVTERLRIDTWTPLTRSTVSLLVRPTTYGKIILTQTV